MHGLITMVNDNPTENYLKEFLAFVYYGSNVNNRLKKGEQTPYILVYYF